MKRNYFKVSMVIAAVLFLAGIGTAAFADWGMGYGRHPMGYGSGPGGHHRGFGYGDNRQDMSAEEVKKVEEEREAFLNATQDLRRNMRQKSLELESELAKAEPDGAKASSIQKEISDLRAQFDQKRIENRFKMEKRFPVGGFYRGSGPFGKMGPGGGGPGDCRY